MFTFLSGQLQRIAPCLLSLPGLSTADEPAALSQQLQQVPLPTITPFDAAPQLRDDYLQAFRNGYVWSQGTHVTCPTNPAAHNLHAIRGWVEGWQSGVAAGGTADLPAKYAAFLKWNGDGKAPVNDDNAAQPPARRPAQAPPTGAFYGRFTFDGDPPQPKPIEGINRDGFDKVGLLDESLLVGADGGIQNILVWISDKNLPLPPRPVEKRLPPPANLTFTRGLFQPRVLAYEAWHGLQIINQEKVPTNVHWQALVDGAFNRLLPPGESQMVETPVQKLPSQATSNVHPWAKAYIFPCGHPYFAVTDAKGAFGIDRVPPGDWEFRAWHERWGYIKVDQGGQRMFRFNVQAGDNDLGIVKVRPAEDGQSATAVPGEREPSVSNWSRIRADRVAAHDRAIAARYVGRWKLTLPRGFQYDTSITQREDGLLKLDCPTKINLLGTFSVRQGQLQLVESNRDGIMDFVWEDRDGTLVLAREEHTSNGARYVGAKLQWVNP